MKITKKRILEIIKEELEEAHMDREGDMAKGQLYHIAKNAMTLFDSLKDEDDRIWKNKFSKYKSNFNGTHFWFTSTS